VFSLSSALAAVTAEAAGTKPAAPTMKLAMVADKSTAATTVVEGECPGMGGSWVNLNPESWGTTILSTVKEV
jgi:hypothetical protein